MACEIIYKRTNLWYCTCRKKKNLYLASVKCKCKVQWGQKCGTKWGQQQPCCLRDKEVSKILGKRNEQLFHIKEIQHYPVLVYWWELSASLFLSSLPAGHSQFTSFKRLRWPQTKWWMRKEVIFLTSLSRPFMWSALWVLASETTLRLVEISDSQSQPSFYCFIKLTLNTAFERA